MMASRQAWKYLLPAIIAVALGVVLIAGPVAAAEGYDISSMSNTYDPALGIKDDGSKICAVWTRFDTDPQAFVRIYDVKSNTWYPQRGTAPLQLSSGSFSRVQYAHCAIDTAGNTHVVWAQGSGQLSVSYRFLAAGADPINGWSPIYTVEGNGDKADIDALYADPNGKVWLVYRTYNGGGYDLKVRSWSPSNNPAAGWSGAETAAEVGLGESARIAVDNAGYAHIVFADSGQVAKYLYRDPQGFYTGPVTLPNGDGAPQVGIAVDRDNGDVHVVFAKNFNELYYTKKTGRDGTSFTGAMKIAGGISYLRARIGWAPGGRLTVVVDDNKANLVALTSGDSGASWSNTTTIASPGGGVESPFVVMDPAGTSYIAYAHRSGSSVYFTTLPPAYPGPSPKASLPPGTISNVQTIPNTLTSTSLKWATEANSDSRVYYGTSPSINTSCAQEGVCMVTNPAQTKDHAITLRGLTPNTTYYYRLQDTNTAGQSLSDLYSFTTPSFELLERHNPNEPTHLAPVSPDGQFAALVAVPAATRQIEWTTDNQTYYPIKGVVTTVPGVLAFSGDVTPLSETTAQVFTIKVRFNGNNGQVTNAQTLNYNPSYTPTFSDVAPNSQSPFAIAIYELAGRGIVQGDNGAFNPLKTIGRAEVAAIVARALGWSGEYGLKSFTDQGTVDNELWNNVRILADYDVARGFGDGSFHPTEDVKQAQAISMVTRAMVAKGYWQYQPDNPALFPEVPADSGHRVDLVTFYHYVPALTQYFQGANWNASAERRGVARIAWDIVQYIENMP